MEKILVFYQKDNNHGIFNAFDCSIYIDGYDFNILIGDKSIEDFLYNEDLHKKIKENCGENLEDFAEFIEVYKEDFKALSTSLVKNDYLQFFNQFNLIQIDYDIEDRLENFIKDNKEFLHNKTILFPHLASFSSQTFEEVKEYYKIVKKVLPEAHIVCCHSNIYGSQSDRYYVDVEDYFEAYKKREDLLNLIRGLNLSPLEEIAFIYDYLKKKKYHKEAEKEHWSTSRGIINVLVGDKIVCVGYTELFKSLVDALGHCYVKIMDIKKRDKDIPTHERALIYVKDDKYGVNGNYEFDVTFDAKREGHEENSNDYYFFLRTLEEMNKANSEKNYERFGFDLIEWSTIEKLMEKLPDVYTEEEFYSIMGKDRIDHDTILINMDMKSFNIEKSGNKKKDLLHIYKLIYESFNKKVEYKTIIKLFYNVRKIEYYLDPDNTSFTYADLLNMVKSYLAPSYANYHDQIKEIIEDSDGIKEVESIIDQFIEECLPNVKEEIERIKVTRNLRQYLLRK